MQTCYLKRSPFGFSALLLLEDGSCLPMIKFTKASRISREETFEDIGDAEGGKDISFRLVFHWEEHMFLPFLLTHIPWSMTMSYPTVPITSFN